MRPATTCRQFGTVELQKKLAKDIPKSKVKVTAFARITKRYAAGRDLTGGRKKAKDYVARTCLRCPSDADTSVEAFEQSVSSSPEQPIRGAVRRRKGG